MNQTYTILSECYSEFLSESTKAEIFKKGRGIFDSMYGNGSFNNYRKAMYMKNPKVIQASKDRLAARLASGSKYSKALATKKPAFNPMLPTGMIPAA